MSFSVVFTRDDSCVLPRVDLVQKRERGMLNDRWQVVDWSSLVLKCVKWKMYVNWLRQITTVTKSDARGFHPRLKMRRMSARFFDRSKSSSVILRNSICANSVIVTMEIYIYMYRHCDLLSLTIRQLVLVACSFEIPPKKTTPLPFCNVPVISSLEHCTESQWRYSYHHYLRKLPRIVRFSPRFLFVEYVMKTSSECRNDALIEPRGRTCLLRFTTSSNRVENLPPIETLVRVCSCVCQIRQNFIPTFASVLLTASSIKNHLFFRKNIWCAPWNRKFVFGTLERHISAVRASFLLIPST